MAASSIATIHRLRAARTRGSGVVQRRRVSPEAGRGLEILGHAIDYLTDEFIQQGNQFNLADPRVQAVLLLMERNREIYFTCPVVPSIGDRLRNWLHFKAA